MHTAAVTVTLMVLHDDGKSCSIFLPGGEGYTFREVGEPAPAARLRVAFSTENEPLWLHIQDLALVDQFWDDLSTAVDPSLLTALASWPGLQPGVYLSSGRGPAPERPAGLEPHPAQADDLMWWVLWDGGIFSDDPFDTLEEAAERLEERVATPWLAPEEARHRWGLARASRSWGYRNFTGT